jgi:hypothetical protein
VWEPKAYISCIKNKEDSLEYAQINFSNLFIYLFIQTCFHTSHSGTYHGNGKSHIHYTSSGIYNLIQLTAGWKEYIKTTVTTCMILRYVQNKKKKKKVIK